MGFTSWRHRPRILWLVVVSMLIGFDQLTKVYFSNTIVLGDAIQVTHWFNLVHVLNNGAAFSLFAHADGWQRPFLIAVSLLVIVPVTVVCMVKKIDPGERRLGAMVVAGGTGNLIDRIQTGAVIDFLDVHWREFHWPAFNLADIFVVSAVALWILMSFRLAMESKSLTTQKTTKS